MKNDVLPVQIRGILPANSGCALFVGNDEKGENGVSYPQNSYACRPPGISHGPFRSTNGCLLFETHYYDPD